MAATFARLCQQVDQTQKELEAEIRQLTAKIDQLETVQSRSKSLRSVRLLSLIGGNVKGGEVRVDGCLGIWEGLLWGN